MAKAMSKEVEEKLGQLQLLEQNLQNFLLQKQTFQLQLTEIDSALEELKKTDKAYKIVANIMVASDKAELEQDLRKKKELAELRIKAIEKQEAKLKDRAASLQADVLGGLKAGR